MNGYDLSSRSRMLKRGWYCLMNPCSASRASASVPTSTKSTDSIASTISYAPRVTGFVKCEATRLRIDFALPT
jgi:hypothetical protein